MMKLQCDSGVAIRAMLDLLNTSSTKTVVFLGPGCSVATKPVAEAAQYWNIVQVSFSAAALYQDTCNTAVKEFRSDDVIKMILLKLWNFFNCLEKFSRKIAQNPPSIPIKKRMN